jgi:hypothetical protein
LYYAPESSTGVEAFPVQEVECGTLQRIHQLSYLQLLIKSMLLRNTSSGQNPLILSRHAFELTLLSIIVEVMIRRNSPLTMPKSLYDDDAPEVQIRLRKNGISVEHGVGLQFMKKLLGTLQTSNLDWLRTELSDGEMVLPSAEIPKPGLHTEEARFPQVLEEKIGKKSVIMDSSHNQFRIDLNCKIHCHNNSGSNCTISAEEMEAFRTRPMQHFALHEGCNMIENYLTRQEDTSVKSSETTMDLAAFDHFEWAHRESGEKWLDRLKVDFGPALVLKWKEAGSGKPSSGTEIKNELLAAALQKKVEFKKEEWEKFQLANLSSDSYIKAGNRYFKPAGSELFAFELKCFGAKMMNDISTNTDHRAEHGNGVSDVGDGLENLRIQMDRLDNDLRELLVRQIIPPKFCT